MESGDELELSDYSETIEEVPEVPVLSVVEEIKPQPTYTSKELNELVTVLKRMVFLGGVHENAWNDQCNEVIQTWFLNTEHPILIIYFSPKQQLTVSLTYPTEPVLEIVYFLREPNHIFSIDNFHDDVTFGQINDDVDGTLLLLMEHLYAPIFFHKTDWNDTNRAEFLTSIHSFLSQMTALHFKLCGLTVLYIPNEHLIDDIDKVIEDDDLIKRFEMVAELWIEQLRMCLGDSEQMAPYDLLIPQDEYDFWIYRCEVLLAVKYQVNHKDFLKILLILVNANSILVKPLNQLIVKIDTEIKCAQDNVRYIKLLIEPCNELWSCETPIDIPMKLPRIINIIRFIWLNSSNFNDSYAVTKLFRFVGNQIIHFCCRKIDVDAIFNGDIVNQIKIANMSIDCCIYYKTIYEKIAKMDSNDDWSLNNCHIFNLLDAFVNRVYDFIEICEAIIIFSRKMSTTVQSQLEFGGDRGMEFEEICQHIETTFDKEMSKIRQISHGILNINNKMWFKNMDNFREMTSSLEEIVDNLIINVFTRVDNVEDGIYALACLHRFSSRDKLHKSFNRKVSIVWNLFENELKMTNDDLAEEYKNNLSLLPIVAGKILKLNVNRQRLNRMKLLFEQNYWLPETIDTNKIVTNYNTIINSFKENAQQRFDEWIQSLGVDVISKLHRLLLKRSLTHSGFFECNIDNNIFDIFREARFLRWLGFAFPVHLSQFFNREHGIRLIYDGISEMITSYNRILGSLSQIERLLLKPMIQLCDKCIAPGSLQLTWANECLDDYINTCNKGIRDLNDFMQIYRHTNAQIVSSCERLCEIIAVTIPQDKPRNLNEIEQIIQIHLEQQMMQISLECENICKLLGTIHDLIDDVNSISVLWTDYVWKFDKLIEQALVISTRDTFRSIHCTLSGNGILGPETLIHVTLDVQAGEIVESPNTIDIQKMLQTTYAKLSQSQSKIQRLTTVLKLPPPEALKQFVEIISNDMECLRWKAKIQDELERNKQKLNEYEEHWMQFAHIWQSNKESVIGEFEMLEIATAQNYDQKLQDLIALSNQVAVREISKKVYFTLVDASKLRQTILIEIDEWKRMYLLSLKNKTESKTMEFFTYTRENGEKLSIAPKTVHELQKCCTIFEQLKSEIDIGKCNLYNLRNQFDVLHKYGVSIDDKLNEMKENMGMQWDIYLKKINNADEVLNNAKDSFKLTLESTRKTPDFFE